MKLTSEDMKYLANYLTKINQTDVEVKKIDEENQKLTLNIKGKSNILTFSNSKFEGIYSVNINVINGNTPSSYTTKGVNFTELGQLLADELSLNGGADTIAESKLPHMSDSANDFLNNTIAAVSKHKKSVAPDLEKISTEFQISTTGKRFGDATYDNLLIGAGHAVNYLH